MVKGPGWSSVSSMSAALRAVRKVLKCSFSLSMAASVLPEWAEWAGCCGGLLTMALSWMVLG